MARAFDDSDAEGESEREDDDGVVVVDRSAVALGAGSRASTRETAPREDGASRDDGVERDGEVEGDAREGGEAVGTGGGCASLDGASVASGVRVGRVGPELRELRIAAGAREYYTMEHYNRLYGAETAWKANVARGKTWCKDVHGPGCRECTTCHFCRQKTTGSEGGVSVRILSRRLGGDEGRACGVGGVWRCAWGRI